MSGRVRLPFAVGCFSLLPFSSPPPAAHPAAPLHRLGHFCRAQIDLTALRPIVLYDQVPPHVNQNNLCNDIESTSGVDLRYTLLPAKMKLAGYSTHFVGKGHLGARTPANLMINRGFDAHFGFLKGGEGHYTQSSGSAEGEGPGTVDLWEGHALSNRTGIYSGYNYAEKAVDTIRNISAFPSEKLFLYIAWHNTHTPLQCPPEWMYPPLGMHGGVDYNNNSERMTYNCMSRILDDGIGNVTQALQKGGLWDSTIMLFAADNGGWAGGSGSNNCESDSRFDIVTGCFLRACMPPPPLVVARANLKLCALVLSQTLCVGQRYRTLKVSLWRVALRRRGPS